MWEANQDVRVGMVGSHQPKRFNEVGSGYTKQYRVPKMDSAMMAMEALLSTIATT
jgi:hypothetical protein